MIYEFDRYKKGVQMAEGITISLASNLREAMGRAARLAKDADVLVLVSQREGPE